MWDSENNQVTGLPSDIKNYEAGQNKAAILNIRQNFRVVILKRKGIHHSLIRLVILKRKGIQKVSSTFALLSA